MKKMEHSIKVGLSFGITTSIITTLGLVVGLYAGTHLKLAVIGAIILLAVCDGLSDAMGIHISEESENKHTPKQIWISTLSTFLAKFIFTLTFLIPILLFKLSTAIIINIMWGLLLLSCFSFYIAREQKATPFKVIFEHLGIAVAVIIITYFLGTWVRAVFGAV